MSFLRITALLSTTLLLLTGVSACFQDSCSTFLTSEGFGLPVLFNGALGSAPGETIFFYLTLPRTLLAILVGASMGIAGALIQTGLQNPFAGPATLGINSGAFLALIIGQLLVVDLAPVTGIGIAFLGGLTTASLAYALSRRIGAGGLNIVLVGMALALALGAVAAGFMIFFENRLDGLYLWGSGSLHQIDSKDLTLFSLPLGICMLISLLSSRALSLFHLGDDLAAGLGVSVSTVRALSIALAILLASLCVSAVGVISFIGLSAPHLARNLGAKNILQQLILSAVLGASLLLIADILARGLGGHDFPIPAGALTTLIGGPFLIYLLLAQRKQRLRTPEPREVGIKPMISVPFSGLCTALSAALVAVVAWPLLSEDAAVSDLYFYRTSAAALAGSIFAASGLVFQGLLRNPLASPDISGFTTIGVLTVVIVMSFTPGLGRIEFALLSLLGSLLLIPVFFLLMRNPAFTPTHIALVGICISAVSSTLTNIVLTLGAGQASDALVWLSGTTYGAGLNEVIFLISMSAVLLTVLFFLSRHLDILQLGVEWSVSLGVQNAKQGMLLMIIAALLCASGVAVVGGIAFIGLMAPHIARALGISGHRRLVVGSALIGGLLLALADKLAQVLIYPFEIPAGLATSVLGGGYFVLLLMSGKYKRR